MGKIEFTITFSGFSDGGEVASGGVITMNAMGAIAISEVDAAVRWMEGSIGGHEFIASPVSLGGGVLTFGVTAGSHRCPLIPNDVSLEGEFGERFHVLIGGDVEELFLSFGADFDAVTAALELTPKCPDKLTGGIEDKDAGVILDVWIAFVHHVEILLGIDGNIVSGLPGVFRGELGEGVVYFVFVFAFADDDGSTCFLSGDDVWKREGGSGQERGFTKEFASG